MKTVKEIKHLAGELLIEMRIKGIKELPLRADQSEESLLLNLRLSNLRAALATARLRQSVGESRS